MCFQVEGGRTMSVITLSIVALVCVTLLSAMIVVRCKENVVYALILELALLIMIAAMNGIQIR